MERNKRKALGVTRGFFVCSHIRTTYNKMTYGTNTGGYKQLVGKLVKYHRVKKKLSQQNLADMLHVERQYVWKIENGRINLTLDYLDKIVAKLECSHLDFFNPLINADFY